MAADNHNGVNLLSGKLALPQTLVSEAGPNGLGLVVSLVYSSDIYQEVITWNADAPVGVVGLGWSLPPNRIMRSDQGTGTTLDDHFSLQDDSGGKRLIATSTGTDQFGDYTAFEAEQYEFWSIRYYASDEAWRIVKEDGTTFVYGSGLRQEHPDHWSRATNLSLGDSVAWGVRWENWIGVSKETTSRSQYAVAWNLARVEDVYGRQVNFG